MAAQRPAHERLTPVAFIGGGILILTSVLFPAADDPADYDGFLALLAEHAARTRFVLLAVPIGILLLATAVVALRERVDDPVGRRWLHAALPAVLVGADTAAVSVQFALANAALSERIDGASDGTVLWAARDLRALLCDARALGRTRRRRLGAAGRTIFGVCAPRAGGPSLARGHAHRRRPRHGPGERSRDRHRPAGCLVAHRRRTRRDHRRLGDPARCRARPSLSASRS